VNAIPDRLALFADAHGHVDLIRQALKILERERVEHIVLLGDLIDRSDQADACALAMSDFKVEGVFGNHEQEVIEALAIGDDLGLRPETIDMFMALEPVIIVDNVCFCHDSPPGVSHNPMEHFFSRDTALPATRYHIVFSGHTHFRAARDEHGSHDLGTGRLLIRPHRHYSINPGAMPAGQFAIWERSEGVIRFFNARP
jgi:predicted phosphodiesterase